jgi:hypothetical protein
MAQTQSPTTEGYVEAAKLLAGAAATAVKSVTCIKTACTADTTQTAAGITKADNGLGLANADTVGLTTTDVTNDTVQVDHEFTASGDVTAKGFGILNDDDDVLYGICCFASDIVMVNGDKLSTQMKLQMKIGVA